MVSRGLFEEANEKAQDYFKISKIFGIQIQWNNKPVRINQNHLQRKFWADSIFQTVGLYQLGYPLVSRSIIFHIGKQYLMLGTRAELIYSYNVDFVWRSFESPTTFAQRSDLNKGKVYNISVPDYGKCEMRRSTPGDEFINKWRRKVEVISFPLGLVHIC